jgi:hypothetical protein
MNFSSKEPFETPIIASFQSKSKTLWKWSVNEMLRGNLLAENAPHPST